MIVDFKEVSHGYIFEHNLENLPHNVTQPLLKTSNKESDFFNFPHIKNWDSLDTYSSYIFHMQVFKVSL